MDLLTLRRNLSRLFTIVDAGAGYSALSLAPAETPELYLRLTTKCMNEVDSMVSSSSLKFNQEQCRYLGGQLTRAVQSARSFFELINTWCSTFASDEDTGSLEIFKLLFSLAKEVESFVQGCCKTTWIQSAILLADVRKHIASLGFSLELCTIVFFARGNISHLRTLTVTEVGSMGKAESEIVKVKADIDDMRLVNDVSALIQCSKTGSEEWQMATFLLKRLQGVNQHPVPDACPGSSNQSCGHSEILFKNLEELEILGKGAFGTVHKARWLGSELVAKKTFHGHDMSDFLHEVSILDGLRHPNIVSLLWYTADLRKCSMILELMDGDLYSLIQKRMEKGGFRGSPFTILETLDMVLQVGEGMLFLHERKIVHRDLKSHNILVNCVEAGELGVMHLHAKVADFGLSKTKENSMTYSDQTQNQGTTRWMAPEMIKTGHDREVKMPQGEELKYPFKSDIYSFGMVCYEILTGYVPFHTLRTKEVKEKVLGGGRPQLPDDDSCTKRLKTLIEACWNQKASARPDFDRICAELRHLKWEQLMMSAWAKIPRSFSKREIGLMTKKFSRDNYLRSHWSYSAKFADVYKGVLLDTGKVVAVQRIQDAGNNFDWFRRLYRNNMTPGFIGFFYEKNAQVLVFEHMPKNYKKINQHPADEYEADSNDPLLGQVRALVFQLHVGTDMEKADGAESLGNLAKGNDRIVMRIIREGAVLPLLGLLGEGTARGQEAAATALGHLATVEEGVQHIKGCEYGIRILIQFLASSRPSWNLSHQAVQAQVARLIAKLATLDGEAQEDLGRHGAIRVLVRYLAYETSTEEDSGLQGPEDLEASTSLMFPCSIPTHVRNYSMGVRGNTRTENPSSGQCSSDASNRPVRMPHLGQEKLPLIFEVTHALWRLAAGNIKNCKLITDTCALLCFVKLMKHGDGELRYNSAMAVKEIAAAARYDSTCRKTDFKMNSRATNAVVEELLLGIICETGEPKLKVACCKAIGSLATIFSFATAKLPITALVSVLPNQNQGMIDVATEAASALIKFVFDRNHLHLENSKYIIGQGAVEHLVMMVVNSGYVKAQISALGLLCYLSLNVPESEYLAIANVTHVLKFSYLDNRLTHVFLEDGPIRHGLDVDLRGLINTAIKRLEYNLPVS